MIQRSGILLVVSGPSGSGKTTLCRRLADAGEAHYSISCTTREPREGEVDGRDYHFLTQEEFKDRIEHGELLEHAEVHGNYYGSLISEVLEHIESGRDVVMDIDVQGAAPKSVTTVNMGKCLPVSCEILAHDKMGTLVWRGWTLTTTSGL